MLHAITSPFTLPASIDEKSEVKQAVQVAFQQSPAGKRSGYFHTHNFISYPQAKRSQVSPIMERSFRRIVNGPDTPRLLDEAGFHEVARNPSALQIAKEVLSASLLTLSLNNAQHPTSYPSRMHRINGSLDAYLNDRPREMQLFHLLGVSPLFDAENFQRLSLKLLYSTGVQATYLSRAEQDALLRTLIDASLAPLKAALRPYAPGAPLDKKA